MNRKTFLTSIAGGICGMLMVPSAAYTVSTFVVGYIMESKTCCSLENLSFTMSFDPDPWEMCMRGTQYEGMTQKQFLRTVVEDTQRSHKSLEQQEVSS